ncbi:hypothetical protein R6Q59_018152 [Mikania micrantha]
MVSRLKSFVKCVTRGLNDSDLRTSLNGKIRGWLPSEWLYRRCTTPIGLESDTPPDLAPPDADRGDDRQGRQRHDRGTTGLATGLRRGCNRRSGFARTEATGFTVKRSGLTTKLEATGFTVARGRGEAAEENGGLGFAVASRLLA